MISRGSCRQSKVREKNMQSVFPQLQPRVSHMYTVHVSVTVLYTCNTCLKLITDVGAAIARIYQILFIINACEVFDI